MQSQLNKQDPLSRNGGFSRSTYPPRAPDSTTMTPCFTQSATPYNNAQSSTQQGSTWSTTGPETGHRSDALPIHHPYGRDLTPGYELNYSMAGPWEAPAPRSEYTMPFVQYDNLGQGGPSYAQPGYDFAANQPHGQTSFSPLLSGAHAAPNNQGAFPVWYLSNSWVNYAVQDELHVTIAFKRIPST